MKTYVKSMVFGVAEMNVQKTARGWTLIMGLIPRDSGTHKYAETLTQSGHKTKKAALESWDSLGDYLEVRLHSLKQKQS